jgi:hypothetical protein
MTLSLYSTAISFGAGLLEVSLLFILALGFIKIMSRPETYTSRQALYEREKHEKK